MKIHIASPCQENWDEMKLAEQGRFCEKCQTIVMDFSAKNEYEVLDFIKKQKDKPVCARFKASQLEKEYNLVERKPIFLNYRRVMALFLASFLSFGAESCRFVPVNRVLGEPSISISSDFVQNKQLTPSFNKFSGKIIDHQTRKGVSKAVIYVEELELTLTSTSEGIFSFNLPKHYNKSLTLKITCDHYPQKVVKIKASELSIFQKIEIEKVKAKTEAPDKGIMMGKVIAPVPAPRKTEVKANDNKTFSKK